MKDYNISMSTEKQSNDPTEQKASIEVEKKIHQTHFSVPETHFQDSGQNNDYEWVSSGPGRLKRVLKKLKTAVIRK